MLSLENVSISYRRRPIVEHVSFEVPDRSSASLVGRSGSGKSSIFGAILGMVKPAGGRILVNGQDVQRMSRAQRRNFLSTTVSVVQRF